MFDGDVIKYVLVTIITISKLSKKLTFKNIKLTPWQRQNVKHVKNSEAAQDEHRSRQKLGINY